jgi:galactonate dehydratase
MKIVRARSIVVGNRWKNWMFVVLETDEGVNGLGEATGGLSTKPIEAWLAELAPLYEGRDPREVQRVFDELVKGLFLDHNPAVAGIELACWDILGKAVGQPVWRLLGGLMPSAVPAYANGWYEGPRDPVFLAERARQVVDMGFNAMKFDPFGSAYGTLSRDELRRCVELVASVRAAVGPSTDLFIEAHDRFYPATAIEVGRSLSEFDIGWLEAPVLTTDLEALGRVAAAVPVPVAAGERIRNLDQFAGLLRQPIAVAQPEILSLGGLWPAIKAAALAEAAKVAVAPHNAQSPFMTVVNMHFVAAVSNFMVLECFDPFLDSWAADLLSGLAFFGKGSLSTTDAAGFGVEIDEAVASQHPYDSHNFLRLFRAGWEWRNRDHE